mmetsp:Transcript_9893/g.40563  ORF Transcript_9893/g.40563 Transcript_9893/m.40563 type:complete len:227 (-) Transcript_9893:431-1111(-)
MSLRLARVDLRHRLAKRLEELRGELRRPGGWEEADHLVLHRVLGLVHVHQLHEQREVVVQGRRREPLGDLGVGRGVLLADAVHVRVPRSKRVGGDLLHLLGNRGGEEQRLALARDEPQDLVDGGLEPHLQQLVRLVEHQHLEVLAPRLQPGRLEVVDETSGGGDEEVAPLRVHPRALRLDVRPAEHHLRLELVELEQLERFLVDLRRELSRRGEDEDGDVALSGRW